MAFILIMGFIMQSNLQGKLDFNRWQRTAEALLFKRDDSTRPLLWGPVTRKRLMRSVLLYASLYLLAASLMVFTDSDSVAAFATGLIAPATGFLYWANPAGVFQWWYLGLTVVAVSAFAIGMVLWFATGNIIAPVFMWIATAVAAAQVSHVLPASIVALPWPFASHLLLLLAPLLIGLAFVTRAELAKKDAARLQRFLERKAVTARQTELFEQSSEQSSEQSTEQSLGLVSGRSLEQASELSVADLQLMRALLDRSLQPVDQFEGFDWLDQFQTAALRYQINFVSYALSASSQVHLPAAQAYMQTAQHNLAQKLLDPRVWGYWKFENMWGNFATSADPIPRDNIMLSGFLAAQFGLARRLVAMHGFDGEDGVVFTTKSGQEFRYSLTRICELLKQQYQRAPFGLLACEPNWVFPLCNSITALGMRTLDTQLGTSHWDDIADRFGDSLATEFTSSNGLFVPFRSSRTGIAAPLIGGGAMQTFPCLFLNALLPEVAARQWSLARENLTEEKGRRALWPVDIGNYRLNRSASTGACAAVAVEMGDSDTALRLLDYLEEDYPLRVEAGVAHRPGVSLWSHALEFTARAGGANALRDATLSKATSGPVIAKAEYPDILLASAKSNDGCLRAVIYPGVQSGKKSLTIGGLDSTRAYRVDADQTYKVIADEKGEACVELLIDGRSPLSITPVS